MNLSNHHRLTIYRDKYSHGNRGSPSPGKKKLKSPVILLISVMLNNHLLIV
jgi:hypothetical protein